MAGMFNLVDEPWIPVTDHGRVSLRDIFSNSDIDTLGGNPVEHLAVYKLLCAIAQAAFTPKNEAEWRSLDDDQFAKGCLDYLDKWHDAFYLYGEKPFLQLPVLEKARKVPFGGLMPEVATGNTTLVSHFQVQRGLDDAEKAMLILTQMAFAFGGKKADKTVVLSPGYTGKKASAQIGPALASRGLLHTYLQSDNLLHTLRVNLLDEDQIKEMAIFSEGLGVAPWESMPTGEADRVAESLKRSLMGRLIPMCRFLLLADDGVHCAEGLQHSNYLEGMFDPTMSIDLSAKKPKMLWVNPEKRPWRELTSLLAFLSGTSQEAGFFCPMVKLCLTRSSHVSDVVRVWSGGIKVSNNAGEFYLTGKDDLLASRVQLSTQWIGENWYENLRQEMVALEQVAKHLYGKVSHYFLAFSANDQASSMAARASNEFWQKAESRFQDLLAACNEPASLILERRRFAAMAQSLYDAYCSRQSSRQIDSWARNKPNFSSYLTQRTAENV